MQQIPPGSNGQAALEVAIHAAREAGKQIIQSIHDVKNIKIKGRANFVSDLDTLSEKVICQIIHENFDKWEIVSEESSPVRSGRDYAWFIDPLDGSTNSLYGIPFIAINIALVHEDTIILGVTYDPLRDEMFTAEKGRGAFLNGRKCRMAGINALEKALVCSDLGYDLQKGRETLEMLQRIFGKALCLRILGSAALGMAYVACGRIGMYFHKNVYPWDIASGILLVTEAGGEVVNWEKRTAGYSDTQIVASNASLNSLFLAFAQ
jgi:myo-inositol-1(or 4)-monophosphatase